MLLLSTCSAPSCYNNPSMLHQSNNAPSCYKNPYGESGDKGFMILGQIGPKLPICLKKNYFGKNWLALNYLPIVSHHATTFQKKSLERIMRYNVAWFWIKLDQIGENDQHYFGLPFVLHHATTIKKYLQRGSWVTMLHNFGQNSVQFPHYTKKGIF